MKKVKKGIVTAMIGCFLLSGCGTQAEITNEEQDNEIQDEETQIVVETESTVITEEPSASVSVSDAEVIEEYSYENNFKDMGDTIIFGNYEQDNNLRNGTEPIEWYVLERTEDSLFVMSRNVLDYQPYNDLDEEVT